MQYMLFKEDIQRNKKVEQMLDNLICANTQKKLDILDEKWFEENMERFKEITKVRPYARYIPAIYAPYISTPKHQRIAVLEDTRELLVLVCQLKELIDNNRCTKEALTSSEINARQTFDINDRNFSWHLEIARTLHSDDLADTLLDADIDKRWRGNSKDKDCWWKDEKDATGRTIVFRSSSIGGMDFGDIPDDDEIWKNQALGLTGAIITMGLSNIQHMAGIKSGADLDHVGPGVTILHATEPIAGTTWVSMAQSFNQAKIKRCKTCGTIMYLPPRRGKKREFCSTSCSLRYRRALQVQEYVEKQAMDPRKAAKIVGIAFETLTETLGEKATQALFAQASEHQAQTP